MKIVEILKNIFTKKTLLQEESNQSFNPGLEERIAEAIEKTNAEKRRKKLNETIDIVQAQKRLNKTVHSEIDAKVETNNISTNTSGITYGSAMQRRMQQLKDELEVIYDTEDNKQNNDQVSSIQHKNHTRKKAKPLNQNSASREKKKRLSWFTAIPIFGTLVLAAFSKGAIANQYKENEKLNLNNSYTDDIETSTTNNTTIQNDYILDEIASTTTTIQANSTDVVITTLDTRKNEIQNTNSETVNENQLETKIQDSAKSDVTQDATINKEQEIKINISDRILVPDGVRYTADCLGGGNSNCIGAVSWRPATEYSIDRVAFVYEGRVIDIMNNGDTDVIQRLNDLAEMYNIDKSSIQTSVLLSLVPGIGDTGWANISVEKMEENVVKHTDKTIRNNKIKLNVNDYER